MTDLMEPFGPKSCWLSVHGTRADDVASALRLVDVREAGWSEAIEAVDDPGLVALTPPLPAGVLPTATRGLFARPENSWVLVLGEDVNAEVVALSAALHTEVQGFTTHRVVEEHRWTLARDGQLVRDFGYLGESGEVTGWTGLPTPAELAFGLPGVARLSDADRAHLLERGVTEDDLLQIAGAWSIDPSALSGPAPGPCLIGSLRPARKPSWWQRLTGR